MLAPVAALGVTVGVMWLLSPWLRRRLPPPGPHQSPHVPRTASGGWAFGIIDELSLIGDSVVLTRAFLGSLAAVALAHVICRIFAVPPHWALVLPLGGAFLLWDLFLIRFVSAFRIAEAGTPLRVLTLRQGLARTLGDSLGLVLGATLWFAGAA
jgi:hypothetical protein